LVTVIPGNTNLALKEFKLTLMGMDGNKKTFHFQEGFLKKIRIYLF